MAFPGGALNPASHWIWVALGGALGATARWAVMRWMGSGLPGGIPWSTLTVNLLGSLLVGVLMGVAAKGNVPEPVRMFLGMGVLGGFTTFSTFSADLMLLTGSAGGFGRALLYGVGSVVGGWCAAWGGLVLATMILRR